MVTMLATPNKVTIFEEGAGDGPFENPLAFLPFVKFDSTFRYFPFVPARTIETSVFIPETIGGGSRLRVITLGPHGQPGVPFIQAFFSSTLDIPMCGTVRVLGGGGANGALVTWTLGVNATDVFIAEERSFATTIGGTFNIPVTVYISSRLAE